MKTETETENRRARKAWVVGVNMGYGHQRTAHALRSLAGGEVINANDYPGILPRDRKSGRKAGASTKRSQSSNAFRSSAMRRLRPTTGFPANC